MSTPAAVAEQAEGLPALPGVEMLAAIPVLDAGDHVRGLVDTAVAVLAERFPGKTTAVLALDMGSTDGTRDTLRAWAAGAAPPPHRLVLQPALALGSGRALGVLLAAAARLEAAGMLLVNGELAALHRETALALADAIATGTADCALPAYTRTAGEGTLTTNLLAPFTGALYGRTAQQVVGGCAALAGAALAALRACPIAPDGWDGAGAEAWLTVVALGSPARIAQVPAGRRPPRAGGREPDVPTIIAQTLAPLFALMERQPDAWLDTGPPRPVPLIGEPPALLPDAERRDVTRLVRGFRLGLKDLLPVWELAMSEATLADLYPLALPPPDEFRLPPALWARVVSDFALAHHEHRLPRDHLLRSLAPLYLGRVAAFFLELGQPGAAPAAVLEAVAQAFVAERTALAARWR